MKQNKITLNKGIFPILLGLLISMGGYAQNNLDKHFQTLEDLQDENMVYYTKIYRIIDDYPDFKYTYVYNNGHVEKVIVENVDNEMDRKRLEVLLFDLKQNKETMKNIPTRTGIYYSVDEEARPENGYREFYRDLHDHLTYPEDAKQYGVEGNVYVKFIVNSDGTISFIEASEDIKSSVDRYVTELKENAIKAVKATSGNWVPATVDGEPVASLVVIPVIFKIEPYPELPAMVM